MLPILEFFEKTTHSYGWALVLLTLLVRALLWPLVSKQTTEMQRFAQVQPMIKQLQEKYKGDPELFQKKASEFMAKNRVNPLGGCLPLVLQLPIFFALFATFSGPPFADKPIEIPIKVVEAREIKTTKKQTSDALPFVTRDEKLSKVAVFPGETEISQGSTIDFGTRAVEGEKLPADFQPKWQVFDKDHKPCAPDLATIDEAGHAEFKKPGDYKIQAIIPGIAKQDQFGFINGLGKVATGMEVFRPENFDALFLILAFGASMMLSQKYMSPATKTQPGQKVDDNQRVQQDVAKIMPIMMTGMFIVIPLPVGVLIYIVISNLVQTLQSWLLSKRPAPVLEGLGDEVGEGIVAQYRDAGDSNNGSSDSSGTAKKSSSTSSESEPGSANAAGASSFKRKTKKKKKK